MQASKGSEKYIYIFVRQDIPLAQQAVQSLHAMHKLVTVLGSDYDVNPPNVVYIGVPNRASLEKTLEKLKAHQIVHVRWDEPDWDMGFTSIATAPLSGERKSVLSNYRLWKFTPEVVREATPLPLALGGSLGHQDSSVGSKETAPL